MSGVCFSTPVGIERSGERLGESPALLLGTERCAKAHPTNAKDHAAPGVSFRVHAFSIFWYCTAVTGSNLHPVHARTWISTCGGIRVIRWYALGSLRRR